MMSLAAVTDRLTSGRFHCELALIDAHSCYLEVNDDQEDGNGSQEVGAVGQVVPVERLLQRAYFVTSLDQQLKQSDHSSFKLGTLGTSDSVRAERLPDDVLTDIGGNEQGYARP